MKLTTLAVALLIASSAFGQTVADHTSQSSLPSLAQCEHDKAQWTDDLEKDFDSVHQLRANTLTEREHEMGICIAKVVPQPKLIGPGGPDPVAYGLELEDRGRYESLIRIYLEEAAYRFETFVRMNHMDEKFWQFDEVLTSTKH